ncbi:UbiA family prenyltransferase [Rhodobacteraceae bacterium]|nr:UbiA family prenyltransferase [Paracoccaceae bacterium]
MTASTVSQKTPETDDTILVVDLDGTLSRTDTLHESLLGLVTRDPLKLLKLPSWLAEGRAGLKARLADLGVVDPASLPLNEAVIETVKTARAAGRRTALVSAADHRQVTAVAEATGLFDEAFGSAENQNLKGDNKAAFLNDRYGVGKFDYIGDSKADVPVWQAAREAITVGANTRLRNAAEAVNQTTRHIDPPTGQSRAMLKAIRPHQWSKNALLFLPLLAAHDFTQIFSVLLGFIAFCLTASAVYVINDLVDLSADRAHPRKCKRPFASGALSATTGAIMAGGLLLFAIVLGLLTGNPAFLAVLGLYLVVTFAYSLWLKRKLIVDVLVLAGLYTVRIIAGGAAASVVLSPWMLGFSMFLFLALAAVKRQAELTDQMITGRSSSGRAYEVEDLPILRGIAISASHAAVLVLSLYISSDAVQTLYAKSSFLWLITPFLLYWVLRMIMATHRGQMSDDPIVYAATDKTSILIILICAAIAVAAAL